MDVCVCLWELLHNTPHMRKSMAEGRFGYQRGVKLVLVKPFYVFATGEKCSMV